MALLDIIIRFQPYWLNRLKFDRLCVASLHCIQQVVTNDLHQERRTADSKTSRQSNYQQSYWLSMKKDLFSQAMFLRDLHLVPFVREGFQGKKLLNSLMFSSLKFHEIYIFWNIKRLFQMFLQQMSLSVQM